MVTTEEVQAALDTVIDPCSAANGTDLSIVEMGLVDEITIEDGHVAVDLMVTSPMCTMVPHFIREIRRDVGALSGVESVSVEADSGLEWVPSMMSDEAQQRRRDRLAAREKAAAVNEGD
jgi:metal-sulfur cluster biosynthetic enzyme